MDNVKIKIGDDEFIAHFDKEDESHITINDKNYTITPLRDYGNNVYSLSINNKVVLAQIDEDSSIPGGSKFKILQNNFSYDAEVRTQTSDLLLEFIKASGAAGDEAPSIKAPMPGLVVKILCNIGDEVKKGDKLVIVEAMKMENALASPVDGVVSKILAEEGQAVDKDADLIELEKSES